MLQPYRTFYRTNSPRAMHLGDLVNIHQQSEGGTLFSKTICPCCGNRADEVLQFLTELNPKTKFGRLSGKPDELLPWWFKDWQGEKREYTKSVREVARGDHVAVQIDARSKGKKLPPWSDRIVKLLKKAINVGDRTLSCKNANRATLREKFDIIASARYYVGIDSGLTHLALMTNTPVILVHPKSWDVTRFYPTNPMEAVWGWKKFVGMIDEY